MVRRSRAQSCPARRPSDRARGGTLRRARHRLTAPKTLASRDSPGSPGRNQRSAPSECTSVAAFVMRYSSELSELACDHARTLQFPLGTGGLGFGGIWRSGRTKQPGSTAEHPVMAGLGIRIRGGNSDECPSHQGGLSAQVLVLHDLRRRGGERRGEASRLGARAYDHFPVHRPQHRLGILGREDLRWSRPSAARAGTHPIPGADLQRLCLARFRSGSGRRFPAR